MALCKVLRASQWHDKPRADLNEYLITFDFVQSWWGIEWQRKQVKQQQWHPKNSIPSLFKMLVTMGLSGANDWGGRRHDSIGPPTQTKHTPQPHKVTAMASLSWFRFLWLQLWNSSVETTSRESYNWGKHENKNWDECMETASSNFFYCTKRWLKVKVEQQESQQWR